MHALANKSVLRIKKIEDCLFDYLVENVNHCWISQEKAHSRGSSAPTDHYQVYRCQLT